MGCLFLGIRDEEVWGGFCGSGKGGREGEREGGREGSKKWWGGRVERALKEDFMEQHGLRPGKAFASV